MILPSDGEIVDRAIREIQRLEARVEELEEGIRAFRRVSENETGYHDCYCDGDVGSGLSAQDRNRLDDAEEALYSLVDTSIEVEKEPETLCICPNFSDTNGFRIGDLTCPLHGVNGIEPLDSPR